MAHFPKPAAGSWTENWPELGTAADDVDSGGGVVIVTDLFGSSPSNLALLACTAQQRMILYGANLPLLVKLAKSRHLMVADAVSRAKDAGRKYINSFDLSPDHIPSPLKRVGT